MNLHEIEEAIRELEQGSCTYSNCQKLASLYIIRDEMKKSGHNMYNYGYYPMYGRESSYSYRRPMYYENDDLMIKKDGMMREQDHMMQ